MISISNEEARDSVESFFTGSRVNRRLNVIPPFQRPYSWTDEEVGDLLDDLWKFTIDPNSTKEFHFLGTVVGYHEGGNLNIIDGQQRLSTIVLMLRAILQKLEDDSANINIKEGVRKLIWFFKGEDEGEAEDNAISDFSRLSSVL